MATRSKTRRGARQRKVRAGLGPMAPDRAPNRALARPNGQDLGGAALERIVAQGATATTQGLGEHTVRSLCRVVRDAYDTLDRLHAELHLAPPLACERGCSHCCWNQVSLTPAEALFLGMHLLEGPPQALDELSQRVDGLLPGIRGKTRQEIGMLRHELPCPLLENGACSAYAARPLVCRGWNSVNAESCRLSVVERDPMRLIENHGLFRELAEAVQTGLLQGTAGLGLEAGFLVITRAIKLMLDQGVVECAADWLAGKPFFARPRTW